MALGLTAQLECQCLRLHQTWTFRLGQSRVTSPIFLAEGEMASPMEAGLFQKGVFPVSAEAEKNSFPQEIYSATNSSVEN